ncbi:hypothetical protein GJ496_003098 [Pomphorhynchus laevis]|nr:hypothetical protein GJ496_003098 [Pomphorhynchus laevis]
MPETYIVGLPEQLQRQRPRRRRRNAKGIRSTDNNVVTSESVQHRIENSITRQQDKSTMNHRHCVTTSVKSAGPSTDSNVSSRCSLFRGANCANRTAAVISITTRESNRKYSEKAPYSKVANAEHKIASKYLSNNCSSARIIKGDDMPLIHHEESDQDSGYENSLTPPFNVTSPRELSIDVAPLQFEQCYFHQRKKHCRFVIPIEQQLNLNFSSFSSMAEVLTSNNLLPCDPHNTIDMSISPYTFSAPHFLFTIPNKLPITIVSLKADADLLKTWTDCCDVMVSLMNTICGNESTIASNSSMNEVTRQNKIVEIDDHLANINVPNCIVKNFVSPTKFYIQCNNANFSPPSNEDELTYEFLFPESMCGRLIGRSGSFIDIVRRQSDAKIIVRTDIVEDNMQVVSIHGYRSQVIHALTLIWCRFSGCVNSKVDFSPYSIKEYYQHFVPMLFSPSVCLQPRLINSESNLVRVSSVISANHIFVHPFYNSYSFTIFRSHFPSRQDLFVRYLCLTGDGQVDARILKQIRSDFANVPSFAIEVVIDGYTLRKGTFSQVERSLRKATSYLTNQVVDAFITDLSGLKIMVKEDLIRLYIAERIPSVKDYGVQ